MIIPATGFLDTASRVINYTYNTANLVKGVELPANADAGINYTYDKNLNMRTAANHDGDCFNTLDHDASNRLKEVKTETETEASGLAPESNQVLTYDSRGEVTGLNMGEGRTAAYSYDLSGNLTGASDNAVGEYSLSHYNESWQIEKNGYLNPRHAREAYHERKTEAAA